MVGGSVALGPHYFLSERKREAFLAKKYGLKMDHYDHLFYIVNRQLDLLPTMKSKKKMMKLMVLLCLILLKK